jgi:RecJ-like exonuclease
MTSDTKLVNGSGGDSLDPAQIDTILNDKKKSDELIAYAENRVAEMLDTAMRSVKVYKGNRAQIYVADFENLRGDGEDRYPLPGRFASRLLDRLEELNTAPCILVLHFKSFISIRMSKRLSDSVGLLEVLARIAEEHPEDVDSSGGHSNAASIKLRGDLRKKDVIKALVEKLRERA